MPTPCQQGVRSWLCGDCRLPGRQEGGQGSDGHLWITIDDYLIKYHVKINLTIPFSGPPLSLSPHPPSLLAPTVA